MSEENVEIVRRIYDEVVARPEAVRELYAPDYEFDATDIAPDVGVIRGFDASVEALRSYFDTFEDFYIELEEVVHADEERVVTDVHDGGRMPGSDSEIRNHRFHVFAFRDGKVVRFSSHLDRNRALEAAGLSEWLLWTRSGGSKITRLCVERGRPPAPGKRVAPRLRLRTTLA